MAEVEELNTSDEGPSKKFSTGVRPQQITAERRTVSAVTSSRESSSSGGAPTVVSDSVDDPIATNSSIPMIRASSHSPVGIVAVPSAAGTTYLAGGGNLPKIIPITGNDPQPHLSTSSALKPQHFRHLTGPSRIIDQMVRILFNY